MHDVTKVTATNRRKHSHKEKPFAGEPETYTWLAFCLLSPQPFILFICLLRRQWVWKNSVVVAFCLHAAYISLIRCPKSVKVKVKQKLKLNRGFWLVFRFCLDYDGIATDAIYRFSHSDIALHLTYLLL